MTTLRQFRSSGPMRAPCSRGLSLGHFMLNVYSVLFFCIPGTLAAPCLTCFGFQPGCTFETTGKCPLVKIPVANLAITAKAGVGGALVLQNAVSNKYNRFPTYLGHLIILAHVRRKQKPRRRRPRGLNMKMAIPIKRSLGVAAKFIGGSVLTVGALAYVSPEKVLRTDGALQAAIDAVSMRCSFSPTRLDMAPTAVRRYPTPNASTVPPNTRLLR